MLYLKTPLDRAQAIRKDNSAIQLLRCNPDIRIIPLRAEESLVDLSQPRACFLTGSVAHQALQDARFWAFLGFYQQAPVFAIAVPDDALAMAGGEWRHLRAVAPDLPSDHAALLGCARSVLAWQRSTAFCGSCGAPTQSAEGGFMLQCSRPECGARHYPRTDPAVIMLVEDGDSVLLHRQHGWPVGMWSILAGFVEPGETLEDAVSREVMEETNIVVSDIRYVASQPWPFPHSMMLGFTAQYAGGILRHDPHELEDARWFRRDEILSTFSEDHRISLAGPYMPRMGSISNLMLSRWLRKEV